MKSKKFISAIIMILITVLGLPAVPLHAETVITISGITDAKQDDNEETSSAKKEDGEAKDDDEQEEDDDSPYSFSEKSITLYTGWKDYYSDIIGIGEEAVITYRSKKEKIATVDEDGIITPVSAGKTRIYADITEDGVTSTCSVKVTVMDPYSEVDKSTDAMSLDSSFVFSIKRFGHRDPIAWTLQGEGTAEIEAVSPTECKLHTLAPGYVILNAECRDQKFSFRIKIYNGKGELFIITPDSDPFNKNYKSYGSYNKKTKGYYLLKSYLERLNTLKGGVLVLKCGTYSVTNTLCIPSNTTIILEDGATILKTDDTGTSVLKATASLFHTVSYTNAAKEGVFKGYNGEHDIQIIGEGTAVIDLNNISCQGIAAAHCNRLTISGITFKNMNTYHFIELAGNANVEISGNYFYGHTESANSRKEAINIDTPDKETHGFNQYWTSFDKTPNKNIYITDNTFYNVECGVGTHKYTEGSAHKNVNILRNTFIDSGTYSIRCMNYDRPVIKDNVFVYSKSSEYAEITIIMNGVKDPEIYNNRFENLQTPISFYHWKNSGNGKVYAPVYNELSETSMDLLRKNYLVNVTNPYFEYYKTYNDFSDESLELHPIDFY